MNVFLYISGRKENASDLSRTVREQVQSHKLTIISSLNEMETILRHTSKNSDIVILMSTLPWEQERILKFKKLLEDVRLILVLRQGSSKDISKWLLLRPRYLDRETGKDFFKVGCVVKKMLEKKSNTSPLKLENHFNSLR